MEILAGLDDDDDVDDDDDDSDDEGRDKFDTELIDQTDFALGEDEDLPILTRYDINLGRFAIHKVSMCVSLISMLIHNMSQITNLSKKVFHSAVIREELYRLCSAKKVKEQVLLRSVSTRWNSVAEMLGRALGLRSVIPDLCDLKQFNKRTGARLHRFNLDMDEWELLEQLFPLLDVRDLLFIFINLTTFEDVSICDEGGFKICSASNLPGYTIHGSPK
jgi:hypothetical protein